MQKVQENQQCSTRFAFLIRGIHRAHNAHRSGQLIHSNPSCHKLFQAVNRQIDPVFYIVCTVRSSFKYVGFYIIAACNSNQVISAVILLRRNGNGMLFPISFIYDFHRFSLMELIVSGNIFENMNMFSINLHNLIACLKSCFCCRCSCIYRSYDRFIYTDKADNNECANKCKNKVKYRTCGNDRDPAPRRFAVEASL